MPPLRRIPAMTGTFLMCALLPSLHSRANPVSPDLFLKIAEEGRIEGLLDGKSISIPAINVRNVEYESRARLDEKREIKAFTLVVVAPQNISAILTDWRASINSGSYFPGVDHLDRRTNATLDRSETGVEELLIRKDLKYGLLHYSPIGHSKSGRDYYIHRNSVGKVDVFIWCSIRHRVDPPCGHSFLYAPDLNVQIEIHYAASKIKYWQEIQVHTGKTIRGYLVPLK